MFGDAKIKLDKTLYEKVKKYAEIAGYASPTEFVAHALEKEIAQLEEAKTDDDIKKRLESQKLRKARRTFLDKLTAEAKIQRHDL